MKTLVYFMHPQAEKSIRGRQILDCLKSKPNTTIREISTIYNKRTSFTPEEVQAEQEFIIQHERIVFAYPMYWYSIPAYGRAFMESVFTMGFAFVYAAKANAKLDGKKFKCIVTLGATAKYFTKEFLGTPESIQCQMNALCTYTGMDYQGSDFYYSEDGADKVAQICSAFD
ncbi:NADPH oxidoreductase [Spironucleus salmonicida]|uniref:NADPH oxidoreductase n=1 Tax=Spironucleus salmonicida TaxID=348837 RepID=V6LAI9_9EUKA|nr:NADPH oxidoreductase [Spironucleus salmonicida]|eukprot:EST41475.1 NADPH oxidoreductase [Spironucleus salmonicida]